jgi:hypothetical protein
MLDIPRVKRVAAWSTVGAVAVAGFGAGYSFGAFDGLSSAFEGMPARASQVVSDADTYTSSANPDTNYGSQPNLQVGGGSAGVQVGYVRFSLSASEVEQPLRLRLPVEQVTHSDLVEITVVNPQWDETRLTAADSPQLGKVMDTQPVRAGDTEVRFDPMRFSAGEVSFAITTPAPAHYMSFRSRESTVDQPSLFADEPAPGATTPSPGTSPAVHGVEASHEDKAGCAVGPNLVPDCGALLGVAPGAHASGSKTTALTRFEQATGRRQDVFHTYHRGQSELFPTADETRTASDPTNPRALFVNWKPTGASWAEIAKGDPTIDAFLDKVGAHVARDFGDRPFFFTVHHEPEDNVNPDPNSGYTASDYAAMYRHVIERLRAAGATHMISVMVYMAYIKWTQEPWHDQLYPGNDVVDWIAWDTYGYSDPGYGNGDFAELVDRVGSHGQSWPGFYRWAAEKFPSKPLMVAEWGVWYSSSSPQHQADVFNGAVAQMAHFPRLKALVYFESSSAEGRDSRVDINSGSLDAYRRFADSRPFSVNLTVPGATK